MKQGQREMPQIENTDKIQQIVKVLQDFVIEGNLKHGTELESERVLAARLGVSRFSLREALRVAQAQGLIEITRGRKPRVARISGDAAANMLTLVLRRTKTTLLDLVAARQALETQIARFAAVNATDEQLEELQNTIDLMEQHQSDPDFCVDQDIIFHNVLVKASGNVVFEVMLAPLAEMLRDSRRETIRQGIDRVLVGHNAILAAVRIRDAEEAAKAMYRHLKMAEEDLVKTVNSSKQASASKKTAPRKARAAGPQKSARRS